MNNKNLYTYIIYKWMWDDFTKEDRIEAYETAKEKGGELYVVGNFPKFVRKVNEKGELELL